MLTIMQEPEVTEVSLAPEAKEKNKNLKGSVAFSKRLKAKRILIRTDRILLTLERKHQRRKYNQHKLSN